MVEFAAGVLAQSAAGSSVQSAAGPSVQPAAGPSVQPASGLMEFAAEFRWWGRESWLAYILNFRNKAIFLKQLRQTFQR